MGSVKQPYVLRIPLEVSLLPVMPYARFPRCFLSSSFDPEDRAVFDWFRNILLGLEFQVSTGEEPTTQSLSEVVRERIQQSQALVAVLTPRVKVDSTQEWLPPSWVRDEIAIARATGRPVAIFAEEHVRVDGILPADAKYERFSRSALGAAAPLVVRFLVALRNELSPVVEIAEDIATIRALGEELGDAMGELNEAGEKQESVSGFHLAWITARSTGRLFTLEDGLREQVVAAYQSLGSVENVLKEVGEARFAARSSLKDALLLSATFKNPRLPEGHPLLTKLSASVESASVKVSVAWGALFRAGYPAEYRAMRQRVDELPPGPERDRADQFLSAILDGRGWDELMRIANLMAGPPNDASKN